MKNGRWRWDDGNRTLQDEKQFMGSTPLVMAVTGERAEAAPIAPYSSMVLLMLLYHKSRRMSTGLHRETGGASQRKGPAVATAGGTA